MHTILDVGYIHMIKEILTFEVFHTTILIVSDLHKKVHDHNFAIAVKSCIFRHGSVAQ